MTRKKVFGIVFCTFAAPALAGGPFGEIFGIGNNQLIRYDITGNSFQSCGAFQDPSNFITNLAMNNARQVYYMNPFEGTHRLWRADLDAGNNMINHTMLSNLNTAGFGIIDGFTVTPAQQLLMTGYGRSEIYRYDPVTNTGNLF